MEFLDAIFNDFNEILKANNTTDWDINEEALNECMSIELAHIGNGAIYDAYMGQWYPDETEYVASGYNDYCNMLVDMVVDLVSDFYHKADDEVRPLISDNIDDLIPVKFSETDANRWAFENCMDN